MPNYQLFCEATQFSDGKPLQNTLNLLWEWLSTHKASINFNVQAEKVEENTPEPSDFNNYGVYPALDVAISIAAIISLIQEHDMQGAVVVSKLSQGSVEAFIEATKEENKELSSQDIRQHPLMQWEIEFQQALLCEVATKSSKADKVKKLKSFARQEGVSNIGLEIS